MRINATKRLVTEGCTEHPIWLTAWLSHPFECSRTIKPHKTVSITFSSHYLCIVHVHITIQNIKYTLCYTLDGFQFIRMKLFGFDMVKFNSIQFEIFFHEMVAVAYMVMGWSRNITASTVWMLKTHTKRRITYMTLKKSLFFRHCWFDRQISTVFSIVNIFTIGRFRTNICLLWAHCQLRHRDSWKHLTFTLVRTSDKWNHSRYYILF